MKPNTGEVLRVITWLVGFFVVYMVPKHMENHYAAVARTSYVTIPLIWFTVLAGFVLGAYVPLIFVRRWAFHPNWPMLAIVFLPFALLSLYQIRPEDSRLLRRVVNGRPNKSPAIFLLRFIKIVVT